jgi:hypothetical protein
MRMAGGVLATGPFLLNRPLFIELLSDPHSR